MLSNNPRYGLRSGWNVTKRTRSPSPPPLTTTKKPKIHDHQSSVNYKLLVSGQYADCTVVGGPFEWNVHKFVLCARSRFFEVAFNGSFQEGVTKSVILADEDPEAVGAMLIYLYTSQYDDGLSTLFSQIGVVTSSIEAQAKALSYKHVEDHLQMYVLGDKFEIEDLKCVAEAGYKTSLKGSWPIQSFPLILRDVFEATPSRDSSLRDSVVSICVEHIDDLLGKNVIPSQPKDEDGSLLTNEGEALTLQQVLSDDGDMANVILEQVAKARHDQAIESSTVMAKILAEHETEKAKISKELERVSNEVDRLKAKLQKAEKQVTDMKAMIDKAGNVSACCPGYDLKIVKGPVSNGSQNALRLRCPGCNRYR